VDKQSGEVDTELLLRALELAEGGGGGNGGGGAAAASIEARQESRLLRAARAVQTRHDKRSSL
jgi:hypothetical protein